MEKTPVDKAPQRQPRRTSSGKGSRAAAGKPTRSRAGASKATSDATAQDASGPGHRAKRTGASTANAATKREGSATTKSAAGSTRSAPADARTVMSKSSIGARTTKAPGSQEGGRHPSLQCHDEARRSGG